MNSISIEITDDRFGFVRVTPERMAELAGGSFLIDTASPKLKGKAFSLHKWYRAWSGVELDSAASGEGPTHMLVEAEDEFQARIPVHELREAAMWFAPADGAQTVPCRLRLYVPHGSSPCLHVKNAVKLDFVRDSSLPSQAEFGFRNEISVSQLRKGFSAKEG